MRNESSNEYYSSNVLLVSGEILLAVAAMSATVLGAAFLFYALPGSCVTGLLVGVIGIIYLLFFVRRGLARVRVGENEVTIERSACDPVTLSRSDYTFSPRVRRHCYGIATIWTDRHLVARDRDGTRAFLLPGFSQKNLCPPYGRTSRKR